MNGIHDMGGFHNFGPVVAEQDEPTFHEDWEGKVFALQVVGASYGNWTSDEYRHVIECMDTSEYLGTSYYEHWLTAVETLLVRRGVFTEEELREAQVRAAAGELPASNPDEQTPDELVAQVEGVITGGGPCSRDVEGEPLFRIGDEVVAKHDAPPGHTRLASYVRGAKGVIVATHGGFVTPDTVAHGLGEQPQHLYSVRFDGEQLWGRGAEGGTAHVLDMWESYLIPA